MATSRTKHEDMKGKRPAGPSMLPLKAKSVTIAKERKPWYRRDAKPARLLPERTRKLVKCSGVPAIGSRAAMPCKRLLRQTTLQGRPSDRCRECKVLQWWWSRMTRDEPAAVIGAIERLARAGRIGVVAGNGKSRKDVR